MIYGRTVASPEAGPWAFGLSFNDGRSSSTQPQALDRPSQGDNCMRRAWWSNLDAIVWQLLKCKDVEARRLLITQAKIEAGQVFLPKDTPWLGDFLDELLAFPRGRHDDQVDSVSQFLNWAGRQERNQRRIAIFGACTSIVLDEPYPYRRDGTRPRRTGSCWKTTICPAISKLRSMRSSSTTIICVITKTWEISRPPMSTLGADKPSY